jgi:hypothetical protein
MCAHRTLGILRLAAEPQANRGHRARSPAPPPSLTPAARTAADGAGCAFSSVGDRIVADTSSAIGIKPLGNYGGKTQTIALVLGSPAIDAILVGALAVDGVTPLCPTSGTTDQRGRTRPQGAGCDVGAYELKA